MSGQGWYESAKGHRRRAHNFGKARPLCGDQYATRGRPESDASPGRCAKCRRISLSLAYAAIRAAQERTGATP